MINIVLAGVGGQGAVLASKLLARTAIRLGMEARTAETIGMAQRGGCVVSHLRMGGRSHSPIIPLGAADAIIAFEIAEGARNIGYLKPGGLLIANECSVQPVSATLTGKSYARAPILDYMRAHAECALIDANALSEEAGSPKTLNMVLLGAAAQCGALGFSLGELEKSVLDMGRFAEMNVRALRLGAGAVK